ncbi:MAG: ATP synthase F1 subunit epsilon [Verrucomicrobiota bacterium]
MLLEIVTPEGKAFSDTVSGVVLPGALGEMGILPNHAALVSTLNAGELRYTKDSKTHELAIGSGFAEITGDRVNVLTDMAVRDSDIDEAAVQAALDRAQSRLKEDVLPEEIAAVEAAIVNSLAQLQLKRKRRTV